MEVLGGIKPEIELLLPVSFALSENICVEYVGLASHIPEEFEVDFVVSRALGR